MDRDSSWEAGLDQVQDLAEREQLRRALTLAQELLVGFRGRIQWVSVLFEEHEPGIRRLPLFVLPQGEYDPYELERDLAHEVLSPVYRTTRVSMPVAFADQELMETPDASPPPGVLYPLAA